jgi:phage terminase large subunit
MDSNIAVIQAAMDMNTHINVAEIDQYLSGMTADEKKARRQGRYVQMGGLIYDKSMSAANVVAPIVNEEHWETFQTKWTHFAAMDHGFNNPTAWLWGCVDPDGRIVIYDEYYVEKEVVSTHAYNVLERESELGVDIGYRVGDPSIRNTDPLTGTSVQLEYAEFGVNIISGNNDVAAGIVRVARLFESGQLLITKNCEKLLWELGRYRWAKWSTKRIESKNNPKDIPIKKDDHLCDALRYLIASRFSMEVDVHHAPSNIMGVPEAVLNGAVTFDNQLHAGGLVMDDTLGSDF